MSIGARPKEGYTLDLARRHLLTGIRSPGRAMREALAAGFGERSRLLIVLVGGWCELLAARKSLVDTLGAVGSFARNQIVLDFVFGLTAFLVVISVLLVVLYFMEALTVFMFGRFLGLQEFTFERARSAVAMSGWACLIPAVILELAWTFLAPDPLDQRTFWNDVLMVSLGAPYLAFCICNSSDASLRTAFLVSMLSGAGLLLLSQVLSAPVDILSPSP